MKNIVILKLPKKVAVHTLAKFSPIFSSGKIGRQGIEEFA